MSTLIVLGYPSEAEAKSAYQKILDLDKNLIVSLQSVAVVARRADGKYDVVTPGSKVGTSAVWGLFWGVLFGLLFFVTALQWGLSLLAGACTLAIMVLPVVMRTTEEALLAVPDAYREGGFGLGAGRLRTVFRCVLPSAVPGILGGVILALGRCVGEVAALIFTAGSIAAIPNFAEGAAALFDSTRTLAVHMYVLSSEGLHVNETYATAVVLLVMVVLLNLMATFAAKKMNKGGTND